MAGMKDMVTEGEVIDLGCGNGRLYELFADNPKIKYTGVDFSEKLIDFAKERYLKKDFARNGPAPHFVVNDLTAYPLRPKSYAGIFLIASYHHIPSRKERLELLQSVHSALIEDGVAMITIWNLWSNKTIKKVSQSWWRKILRKESGGPFDIFYPFNDNGNIVYRYYRMFTMRGIRKELEKYFTIYKEEKWKKGQNLAFYLKRK
jgi:SAM-dependent methyltransferase